MIDQRWQNLANCIIELAVYDYREALRSKDKMGGGESIDIIRQFFLSKYFMHLTNIDGKWLLERLDKEVR